MDRLISANDSACQGYNVRALIDRAGAIVERYAYDDYGRPFIRESCGRGDMNQDTKMNSTDDTRFAAAKSSCSSGCIWDPRADMDDDGDVDSTDQTLYDSKRSTWTLSVCDDPMPTVAQAFSDVGNWYMFQGVLHLALDTQSTDTDGKLVLNHHRARFEDPVAGKWVSRDPLFYNLKTNAVSPPKLLLEEGTEIDQVAFYTFNKSNSESVRDPFGLTTAGLVSGQPSMSCAGGYLGQMASIGCPPNYPYYAQSVSRSLTVQSPCGRIITNPSDSYWEVVQMPQGGGTDELSIGNTSVGACGCYRASLSVWGYCLTAQEYNSSFGNATPRPADPNQTGGFTVYDISAANFGLDNHSSRDVSIIKSSCVSSTPCVFVTATFNGVAQNCTSGWRPPQVCDCP